MDNVAVRFYLTEKATKNFRSTRRRVASFFFLIGWKFLIYRNITEALNFRDPIFVAKRKPYPGNDTFHQLHRGLTDKPILGVDIGTISSIFS